MIPIERLTEADRKWMLTAEYGGTGGKPIESGMVVEEPDIEIGAGVSSKGLSQLTHINDRTFANLFLQQSADAWQPTRAANADLNHPESQTTEDIHDVIAAWT